MPSLDLDRKQAAKLDKETLISIILEMQQMLVEQAVEIQALRDQLAKSFTRSIGKEQSEQRQTAE